MVTMFVRHQVNDFAQWKQVYVAFAPEQKRLGVRAEAVYQAADDPNDVTVSHEFDSIEAAQQFVGSQELHNTMAKAGIAAQPTIWFTQRA